MHLSACLPVLLLNDLQNRTDEEDVAQAYRHYQKVLFKKKKKKKKKKNFDPAWPRNNVHCCEHGPWHMFLVCLR